MALFSRSTTNDMWVLLLEKAYAKLHQNYFTLRGGLVSEALLDLTGCPTELIQLEADQTKLDIFSGQFFYNVQKHLEDGYIVVASTEGEELWAEVDKPYMPNGLMKAHSYNVISGLLSQSGLKLYKLRNIWRSTTTWDGDYRVDSPYWTQELIEEFGIDLEQKDALYMTEEEFTKNFATMTVCMVRQDDETLRLKGEFLKSADRGVRSKF